MMDRWFRIIAWSGVALALIVVTLGAWVRLTDAGLGCPDWPGCYGRLIVSEAIASDPDAAAMTTERPLEAGKAWREMIHRYFASTLGLLCLLLAGIAIARRKQPDQPVVLPMVLLGLVIFQGLLGMWTVTLQLLPLVVVMHLVGGFSVLACLFWLARHGTATAVPGSQSLRLFALAALAALVVQIFLGGWTSSNYAAVACPDFPTCQTQWWPQLADFAGGFDLIHEIGLDYEGGVMDHPARVAIHFVHRLGAVLVSVLLVTLALRIRRSSGEWSVSAPMLIALIAQVLIGISIVVFGVPLAVAVAHNGVAAILLLTVINANQRLGKNT